MRMNYEYALSKPTADNLGYRVVVVRGHDNEPYGTGSMSYMEVYTFPVCPSAERARDIAINYWDTFDRYWDKGSCEGKRCEEQHKESAVEAFPAVGTKAAKLLITL